MVAAPPAVALAVVALLLLLLPPQPATARRIARLAGRTVSESRALVIFIGARDTAAKRSEFTASAKDARVPERVAARLWVHAEPVRAVAHRDAREQIPRLRADRVDLRVVAAREPEDL